MVSVEVLLDGRVGPAGPCSNAGGKADVEGSQTWRERGERAIMAVIEVKTLDLVIDRLAAKTRGHPIIHTFFKSHARPPTRSPPPR